MTRHDGALPPLGALFATAFLLVVPATASSAATTPDVPGRKITRWDQTFTFRADGSAGVRLEIDFDFGNDPGHGPYLLLPTRQGYNDDYDRVYHVSDVEASSPTGAPSAVHGTEDRYFTEVKVGDANAGNVSGVQTYVIASTVSRVMNATTAAETGRAGLADPCAQVSVGGSTATFVEDYLSPGKPFTVNVLYPTGSFQTEPQLAEHSDVKRAFTLNLGTGIAAAVILGVGPFVLIRRLRLTAVDKQYAGQVPGLTPVDGAAGETVPRDYKAPVAVQYEPPPDMRPEQIGTRVDE